VGGRDRARAVFKTNQGGLRNLLNFWARSLAGGGGEVGHGLGASFFLLWCGLLSVYRRPMLLPPTLPEGENTTSWSRQRVQRDHPQQLPHNGPLNRRVLALGTDTSLWGTSEAEDS
jgi:hypothetical protein